MQMRARGVAGRADRAERIAAQNALPGGDRYFAAMGVKRLIAVRVADGQIFAEHGALPHHADCAVGKAGKRRALIGGKVEEAAAPSALAGIRKEHKVGLAWLAEQH